MKIFSFSISILFSLSGVAADKLTPEQKKLYQKVFPTFSKIETIKVSDEVSAEKNNRKLLVVFNNKKRIGFIRNINTTTGCNSACLPIKYSSFFNAKGEYQKLISPPGLTKIYHNPMTVEDLGKLDFILAIAPKILNGIKDPKEMTDALSGETFKKYKEVTVEGAAYSTLRIHLYHQETLKHIKNYIRSKSSR